jgi:hypothetical protein
MSRSWSTAVLLLVLVSVGLSWSNISNYIVLIITTIVRQPIGYHRRRCWLLEMSSSISVTICPKRAVRFWLPVTVAEQ